MIVYREIESLEKDLGFSAKTLYMLANETEKHYHSVRLPKRNGSFRVLSVPDDLLKLVQRRIAEKLLALEPISKYATAYKSGASTKKNAQIHVGKAKILKLDIKSFFDSILYSQVKEKVFPAEKYSESNRVLLTMLCYYKETLPQGAPTSPAVSNIVMRDFDEIVGAWCKQKNIDYTRYCDDMTFSGSFNAKDVIDFVSAELYKMGLFLNKRKTVVALDSDRQSVTGIVVNKHLNTSVDYRKKLRQEVYYCRRYGCENHLKHIKSNMTKEHYLHNLLGRLNYALHVSPDDKRLSDDRKYIIGLLKSN